MTNTRNLRRKAASVYCKENGYPVAEAALAKYAVVGGGPIYRKFGRIPIYATDDLDAWIAEKLSPLVRSSSELAQ